MEISPFTLEGVLNFHMNILKENDQQRFNVLMLKLFQKCGEFQALVSDHLGKSNKWSQAELVSYENEPT